MSSLTWILDCFQGPAKELHVSRSEKLFNWQDKDFDLPLHWLAMMITRSDADIQAVLETILDSRYLAGVDRAKYEELVKYCQCKEITCNRQEGLCRLSFPNQFGFWLSNGVRSASGYELAEDMQACVRRFDRIE